MEPCLGFFFFLIKFEAGHEIPIKIPQQNAIFVQLVQHLPLFLSVTSVNIVHSCSSLHDLSLLPGGARASVCSQPTCYRSWPSCLLPLGSASLFPAARNSFCSLPSWCLLPLVDFRAAPSSLPRAPPALTTDCFPWIILDFIPQVCPRNHLSVLSGLCHGHLLFYLGTVFVNKFAL